MTPELAGRTCQWEIDYKAELAAIADHMLASEQARRGAVTS